MLETSARLLRLLSLLQARRDWTSTELATRLGVTKDRVAPQARRERAAELSAQGAPRLRSPARWTSRGRAPAAGMPAGQGGRAELAGPGRWGRPSRLSEADWRRVENALLAGAVAQGFDTELRSPAGGRRIGRGSRGALTRPGRGPMGQPQGLGVGQPCLRFVGGVGRRRAGRRAGARRARAVVGFPHQAGLSL
jgi:hypothetical protein